MPTTPVVQYGSFGPILLGMKSVLVANLQLPPSACIITVLDPDDVPHLHAQKDILLRVMGETPDREIIDGSGRVDNRRFRTVQVIIRTRMNLDVVGSDPQRLTDASLGHIAIEDAVVNFLECQFILDANGDNLLVSPLRVGPLTATKRDSKEKSKGWIWSGFEIEAHYARNLDLSLGY